MESEKERVCLYAVLLAELIKILLMGTQILPLMVMKLCFALQRHLNFIPGLFILIPQTKRALNTRMNLQISTGGEGSLFEHGNCEDQLHSKMIRSQDDIGFSFTTKEELEFVNDFQQILILENLLPPMHDDNLKLLR